MGDNHVRQTTRCHDSCSAATRKCGVSRLAHERRRRARSIMRAGQRSWARCPHARMHSLRLAHFFAMDAAGIAEGVNSQQEGSRGARLAYISGFELDPLRSLAVQQYRVPSQLTSAFSGAKKLGEGEDSTELFSRYTLEPRTVPPRRCPSRGTRHLTTTAARLPRPAFPHSKNNMPKYRATEETFKARAPSARFKAPANVRRFS